MGCDVSLSPGQLLLPPSLKPLNNQALGKTSHCSIIEACDECPDLSYHHLWIKEETCSLSPFFFFSLPLRAKTIGFRPQVSKDFCLIHVGQGVSREGGSAKEVIWVLF